MPCRKRKGKQNILPRQRRRQCFCLYVVANKYDVFRPVRPQRVQNGIQLRIAQDHKNHIVHCIRCKFRHHRNATNRGAERKFVLDPQPVLLNLRSPVSPRKQSDILSGAQQISCQIASQNACTIYQNFHSLSPNPIFTIYIFIPLSPTLARNRKKPLTEGSFKSLYPSI